MNLSRNGVDGQRSAYSVYYRLNGDRNPNRRGDAGKREGQEGWVSNHKAKKAAPGKVGYSVTLERSQCHKIEHIHLLVCIQGKYTQRMLALKSS